MTGKTMLWSNNRKGTRALGGELLKAGGEKKEQMVELKYRTPPHRFPLSQNEISGKGRRTVAKVGWGQKEIKVNHSWGKV